MRGAELLTTHLKSLRNESSFNSFYDTVYHERKNCTEEPCLPHLRKTPRRYDQGGQSHQYECPKARYCHAYFETIELAAGEVEKRFAHKDMNTINEIEEIFLKACNGEAIDTSLPVIQSYFGKTTLT